MKNKIIYTVTAYRYGSNEKHSYIVGVYSKKLKSLQEAEKEEEFRGGKYSCEVVEWTLDSGMAGAHFDQPIYKVIKYLENTLI